MLNKFDLNLYLGSKLEIKDSTDFDTVLSISDELFTKNDVYIVDVIYQINQDSTETLITYLFLNPSIENTTIYQLLLDGLYKIIHLIIPNLNWLLEYTTQTEDSIYNFVYITDGLNFYRYNDTITLISFEELLEINPLYTTITREEQELLQYYNLKNCYYNMCKELLYSNCYTCQKSSDNALIKEKRDIIWISLNVIKYLIEKNSLHEANEILLNLISCGQMCSSTSIDIYSNSTNNCGCNE